MSPVPGEIVLFEATHERPQSAFEFRAIAELTEDGEVIDRVEHEVHVWCPNEPKRFMTVEDGEFMLDGKRWRAHGVNYMPSSASPRTTGSTSSIGSAHGPTTPR